MMDKKIITVEGTRYAYWPDYELKCIVAKNEETNEIRIININMSDIVNTYVFSVKESIELAFNINSCKEKAVKELKKAEESILQPRMEALEKEFTLAFTQSDIAKEDQIIKTAKSVLDDFLITQKEKAKGNGEIIGEIYIIVEYYSNKFCRLMRVINSDGREKE